MGKEDHMGITAKIAKRLEICDKLHKENTDHLKRLTKESSDKFDGANRHIKQLKARLDKNPADKKAQNEYAGMVNARAMFYASHKLNKNLLKNED